MINDKSVIAIIQARMGSTRLPGKVLMKLEGIPILTHIICRLKSVSEIDKVIVATSVKKEDDAIAEFCCSNNILCIRGSEENVLDRFGKVADSYPADVFIRATGDNPMIDVQLIKDMLEFFVKNELTYSCYKDFPIGSGVEIFAHESLISALKNADKPYEYEHVTPYMYQRMTNRKVEYFISNDNDSQLRMTVDTEEDFQFSKNLFSRLYKTNHLFGIREIKQLLLSEPDLKKINSAVHQKTLGE